METTIAVLTTKLDTVTGQIEDQKEERNKEKDTRNKFYLALIGAIITALGSSITALFKITK